jgi:hypothetical protein
MMNKKQRLAFWLKRTRLHLHDNTSFPAPATHHDAATDHEHVAADTRVQSPPHDVAQTEIEPAGQEVQQPPARGSIEEMLGQVLDDVSKVTTTLTDLTGQVTVLGSDVKDVQQQVTTLQAHGEVLKGEVLKLKQAGQLGDILRNHQQHTDTRIRAEDVAADRAAADKAAADKVAAEQARISAVAWAAGPLPAAVRAAVPLPTVQPEPTAEEVKAAKKIKRAAEKKAADKEERRRKRAKAAKREKKKGKQDSSSGSDTSAEDSDSSSGSDSDTSDSTSGDDNPRKVRRLEQHKPSSLRLPTPAKFSGVDSEIVEDFIFAFESYLTGNRIPRVDWPKYVMPLLTGKALAAWLAVARPLQEKKEVATWELLTKTLTDAFPHIDLAMNARKRLHEIEQTGKVAEYLQRMRVLIARAGAPATSDTDLMLIFWRGLKGHIREQAKVDPRTGKWWSGFEDLASYALTIDSQHKDFHPAQLRNAQLRQNNRPPRATAFQVRGSKGKVNARKDKRKERRDRREHKAYQQPEELRKELEKHHAEHVRFYGEQNGGRGRGGYGGGRGGYGRG